MSTGQKTLLCIDDHKPTLAGWCLYLQGAGYLVETAHGPQEGLQLFATQPIDLVLLDYAMPEVDGGEVAATMKRIKLTRGPSPCGCLPAERPAPQPGAPDH